MQLYMCTCMHAEGPVGCQFVLAKSMHVYIAIH